MAGGYVKVQSLPYAYDHGAEAKPDDPGSALVVWFLPPLLWVAVRSNGIGPRIIHQFCGSVKIINPQQSEERAVLHDYESEQPFMREHIVWISYLVCEGASIL